MSLGESTIHSAAVPFLLRWFAFGQVLSPSSFLGGWAMEAQVRDTLF